jgi:hypothetical protein
MFQSPLLVSYQNTCRFEGEEDEEVLPINAKL